MSSSDSLPGISTHHQVSTLWSHKQVSLFSCQLCIESQLCATHGSWCRDHSKEWNSPNPTILRPCMWVEKWSSVILLYFYSFTHAFIHFSNMAGPGIMGDVTFQEKTTALPLMKPAVQRWRQKSKIQLDSLSSAKMRSLQVLQELRKGQSRNDSQKKWR